MYKNLIKNKYGFFEIKNKPTQKKLSEYYATKYYQEAHGSYELTYPDSEIQYFINKIKQKHQIVQTINSISNDNFLDVGAGEGFALKYFDELGYNCLGLDFSNAGVKNNNPAQARLFTKGDIFENLSNIIKGKQKFDLIFLDNVLEHVLDPYQLLSDLKNIITSDGVLVADVPNDFSVMQNYLLKNKHIDNEFWVSPPDHLSYFNKDGLTNLSTATGWHVNKIIADYPIDLDLLSLNSNYIKDKTVGKNAHKKRIAFENLIHSISPEKTNKFYESLMDLGLGRNIIAFLTKA